MSLAPLRIARSAGVVVMSLQGSAIFSDLERPLTQIISRARYYSTVNISETVQDRGTVIVEY